MTICNKCGKTFKKDSKYNAICNNCKNLTIKCVICGINVNTASQHRKYCKDCRKGVTKASLKKSSRKYNVLHGIVKANEDGE